jgi:sterol desaturase/sphingolipid hydroxylase (fatty acid hydroxylase superfamily)
MLPTLAGPLSLLLPGFLILILVRIEALAVRDTTGERFAVLAPEKRLEYRLIGAILVAQWLANNAVAAATTPVIVAIANYFGGGFLRLPVERWGFVPCFLISLFVFDGYTYFVHRAYHKIPFLWAMHSLHHSATAMSATTGCRHFWFEPYVTGLLFAPLLGIMIQIPSEVLFPMTLVNFFIGLFTHFAAPLRLGRFTYVINNPQWHRIHHSAEAAHCDKNFANVFPIFDLVFGTAWMPGAKEFPPTGLFSGDAPRSALEGMIWPLRSLWRIRGRRAVRRASTAS